MTQTQQIQELQSLLDELSAEVADLTEAVDAHKADSGYVATIGTGLTELLALLRNRKEPEAPKVAVTVNPTPIHFKPVVQVIECHDNFRLTMTYDRHDRIETADIVRVKT